MNKIMLLSVWRRRSTLAKWDLIPDGTFSYFARSSAHQCISCKLQCSANVRASIFVRGCHWLLQLNLVFADTDQLPPMSSTISYFLRKPWLTFTKIDSCSEEVRLSRHLVFARIGIQFPLLVQCHKSITPVAMRAARSKKEGFFFLGITFCPALDGHPRFLVKTAGTGRHSA